eukprot:2021858-Prymnesium_polylepis.3
MPRTRRWRDGTLPLRAEGGDGMGGAAGETLSHSSMAAPERARSTAPSSGRGALAIGGGFEWVREGALEPDDVLLDARVRK